MENATLPKGIQSNGKGLRIVFRYDGHTKREQVSKTARESDIREAVAIRNEVLALIKSGNFTEEQYYKFFNKVKSKRTLTFNEVVSLWLIQLEKDRVRGVLTKSTKVLYKRLIQKSLEYFKHKPITSITGEDLEEFEIQLLNFRKKDNSGYSRKYISDCVSTCGLCLDFARKKNYINSNPIRDMKRTRKNFKTDKTVYDLFDLSTAKRYAKVADELNYPNMGNLIRFLFHTGLRLSEAFAISWEDINLGQKELSINKSVVSGEYKQTKTSLSTRTIILSDEAVLILINQAQYTKSLPPEKVMINRYGEIVIEEVSFVFKSDTTGKPYLANHSYRKQWNKILNHKLLKNTQRRQISNLRHSYATNQIIAGNDLMYIAQTLGHSTINTMYKHYAKAINHRLAKKQNPINKGIISRGNIK